MDLTDGSGIALITTAFAAAFIHTVIPDHWLPFVIVGKHQKWGFKKTVSLAGFSACIHVFFSLGLGAFAFFVGRGIVDTLETVGHSVSTFVSVFLIVFGMGYFFWDWKWGHHHHHHHGKEGFEDDDHLRWTPLQKEVTGITIAVVLGVTPCVILVPLLVASVDMSMMTTLMVAMAFSVSTVVTMIAMTALGCKGIERFHFTIMEKYGGLITSAILVFIGIFFLIHDH